MIYRSTFVCTETSRFHQVATMCSHTAPLSQQIILLHSRPEMELHPCSSSSAPSHVRVTSLSVSKLKSACQPQNCTRIMPSFTQ